MNRIVHPYLLPLMLLQTVLLSSVSGDVLDPADLPEEWNGLLDRLHARAPLRASFTEVRHLPFRKKSTELEGVLRVAPGIGVSLHYPGEDESMTLLIDAAGLASRKGARAWKALPDRPEIAAIHQAIAALLTFDLETLGRTFILTGQLSQDSWTMELLPKADRKTGRLKGLVIHGNSDRISRIEARLGRDHGISIFIHDNEPKVIFQSEEYARYFR